MGVPRIQDSIRPLMRRHAFGLLLVMLSAWALFGEALWREKYPAFRDAGHFYYPTLTYTTEKWASGSPPLWNAFDNLGQPLAADATSMVFYPGRVILHLPIGMPRAITLFIACHWLLAVFGARRLAKRWASSTDAQYLAALVYALSGYVTGQVFNLPFLIGAAWLPWAWEAWESLRLGRELRNAILLAIPLALMVLGGDPQTAYHVALLALLDSISWRRTVRDAADAILEPHLAEDAAPLKRLTWPWFRSRWLVLAAACLLGVLLAAVQVIPSFTWTLRTDRAVFDAPRTIWEWAGSPGASFISLFASPTPQTHDTNLYDFSFAPARIGEMILPGIFGELGPLYQNWLKAATPEMRWWTSTNYLGLFPFLVAIFIAARQWSSRHVRSAAFVAAIALLSSFGDWGLGAAWQAIAGSLGEESPIGSAVGGLYWFWATLFPGYIGFRYPSKWLLLFSLAIALLAGRGVDLFSGPAKNQRLRETLLHYAPHFFVALALFTSIAWLALLLVGPAPFSNWAKAPPHPLFGPFDVEGACRCIRFALARTFVVSIVLAMLLFAIRSASSRLLPQALIGFTCLELFLVSWSGPLQHPAAYWSSPANLNLTGAEQDEYRLYRAASSRLEPPHWRDEFDLRRFESIQKWEVATRFPRYNWLTHQKLVEAHGTTMSADHRELLNFLQLCPPDDVAEPAWTTSFHPYDLFAVRDCIVPRSAALRDAARLTVNSDLAYESWRRSSPLPRAWIAQAASLAPELQQKTRSSLARQTRAIFLDKDHFRDLHREPIIESDAPDLLFSEICDRAVTGANLPIPRIEHDEPERIEIGVKLEKSALLVLSDSYDPGWSAVRITDEGEPIALPIYRVNRVLRGVCLPKGEHRVVFRYRPWEIGLGGVISLAAWVILLPAATFLRARRRRGGLHPSFRQSNAGPQ